MDFWVLHTQLTQTPIQCNQKRDSLMTSVLMGISSSRNRWLLEEKHRLAALLSPRKKSTSIALENFFASCWWVSRQAAAVCPSWVSSRHQQWEDTQHLQTSDKGEMNSTLPKTIFSEDDSPKYKHKVHTKSIDYSFPSTPDLPGSCPTPMKYSSQSHVTKQAQINFLCVPRDTISYLVLLILVFRDVSLKRYPVT